MLPGWGMGVAVGSTAGAGVSVAGGGMGVSVAAGGGVLVGTAAAETGVLVGVAVGAAAGPVQATAKNSSSSQRTLFG